MAMPILAGNGRLQKRTGVFFTYFQGERLRDFPWALDRLLERDNVAYYDAVYESRDGLYYLSPLNEELLARVHSTDVVHAAKMTGDYEGALYSAGGTVQAANEIWDDHIDNAFVFTSFGDHHAGRDFSGGMCYFNGAALAIVTLRDRGASRFAIVDTDAHHADGTRDIFGLDRDVFHCCFCFQDYEDQFNNIDIAVPPHTTDERFLAMMRETFVPRALAFGPELVFWEYGFDATRGEYGDRGLSPDCHIEIARLIKAVADETCRGRIVAILCGGASRRIAAYTIPRIIAVLAGADAATIGLH